MKNKNLVLIILLLSVVLVFILIVGPETEEVLSNKEEALEVSSVTGEAIEKEPILEYGFNLKYTKYLVEEPYTYVVNGEERCFQFDVMREKIDIVEKSLEKYRIAYLDNYKNRNGKAPKYKGENIDALGNHRSASVPAYANIKNLEEFVYLPDGTLVEVLEEDSTFTLVNVVGTDLEYSIPSRYVDTYDCLINLEKVIIVDRKNQNIATFEKEDGWNVTSYSMATTGKIGKYHQPTPLGYFYAIEKKPRFFYVKDGTNIIDGYAPYAIRFTAGAYIHGVATSYKYDAEGNKLDSGIKEYSKTIGTIPLSHKCVRNYTSHAKFIYDWYEQGKTIVIVIE